MVANVDGQTDEQTDGKPDPYITPCLRQAQQKALPVFSTDDSATDKQEGLKALNRSPE